MYGEASVTLSGVCLNKIKDVKKLRSLIKCMYTGSREESETGFDPTLGSHGSVLYTADFLA